MQDIEEMRWSNKTKSQVRDVGSYNYDEVLRGVGGRGWISTLAISCLNTYLL